MAPYLVPALTFILAALVAFSTGSSWGTMAILYPLILPASWLISEQAGLEHAMALSIFYNVVSCVLAGSVLGDHCSPISDTTILSSLASSCNHIEHVRTQLPYALTVGGIAIGVGTIPAAYGIPAYVTFPAGILLLFIIVQFFGKKTMEKKPIFKNSKVSI
jgi:Na+/H+ antiporter NhaC